MSYLKLFKTTSDHAVGMQCVNQALDNNLALYLQVDAKHAVGTGYNDVFLGPGRHDDVLIARTVCDFYVDTSLTTPVAYVLVGGPMLVGAPERVKTGQWKIYVSTPQLFAAKATVKGATIGAARDAMCFVTMESAGPFVTVSTWNVSGGVLADYDFSLVLWAEDVA